MEVREEEFWEAESAEEDGAILETPTPVSLDAPVGPTKLSTWEVQGTSVGVKIWEVYASLSYVTKDNYE